MKKKLIALLLAIVTVLSVVSMFTVTAFAADNDDKGNTIVRSELKIRCANAETELGTLRKCFPEKKYSAIKVNTGSEVSYLNVWVTNSSSNVLSNKVKAYPNGKEYRINYYAGISINKDVYIVFKGSQPNLVVQKKANLIAYSY